MKVAALPFAVRKTRPREYPWSVPSNAPGEPQNDPRMVETVTTLADTNQVSKHSVINPNDSTVIGFDQFNNQTDVWEYDFGAAAPGALIRRTHTDYVSSTSYTDAVSGAHLRSLPSQVSIYDAG